MCPRGVAEAAARSRLHTEELRSVACNETTASSLLGRRCAQLSIPVRIVVGPATEQLEDLTQQAPSALKHCLRQQAADRRDRYGEALALQVANLKRQIGKLFLDFYL